MHLKQVQLQNVRSYSKSTFEFTSGTTFIIGPNTAGKTNLLESIYALSYGKSFRAEKDTEMIAFRKEFARISGSIEGEKLEVFLSHGAVENIRTVQKRYLVNKVGKRRADFMGHFLAVLFSPSDLDLVSGSPSLRRAFLNEALELTDRTYRFALLEYARALKQRNALLHLAKERKTKNVKQFEYWDEVIIRSGQLITEKRKELIAYLNKEQKDVFNFFVVYDASTISRERLDQYDRAEVEAGVTLVGPHRDDVIVYMQKDKDVSLYGSRGQQRLAVLQLKLLEIAYIERILNVRPAFLLDDVFSELDKDHIQLVLNKTKGQQTIMTTTHKEFIPKELLAGSSVIELERS